MTKRSLTRRLVTPPTSRKRLRIGSQDFTVVYRRFYSHSKLCGHMDPLKLKIEIDTNGNPAVAFQTLIHEVLHVISD